MGMLMFAAGTLVGICLGVVLISLLCMARGTKKIFDLLDRREEMATPQDTYYLRP